MADEMFAWLYQSDRILIERHFHYYFTQAAVWKAQGHDCVYGLYDDATIIGAVFVVPPGCTWDEDLLHQFWSQFTDSVKLQEYEQFYDDLFDLIDPNHYYLLYLAVSPKHQNRGHGAALLKYCMSLQRGSKLVIDVTNPVLIKFYQKFGFQIIRNNTLKHINAWIMCRD